MQSSKDVKETQNKEAILKKASPGGGLAGAKLWEKNYSINKEIERFTVGRDREMDLYLAKYDVLGSMAHITMLESIGLIGKEELPLLLDELRNIYEICDRGDFVIEDGVEAVSYTHLTLPTICSV